MFTGQIDNSIPEMILAAHATEGGFWYIWPFIGMLLGLINYCQYIDDDRLLRMFTAGHGVQYMPSSG